MLKPFPADNFWTELCLEAVSDAFLKINFSRRATACSDSPDSEVFVSTPFARPGTSIFARRPS